MKKILIALLCLAVLSVSLVGCDSINPNDDVAVAVQEDFADAEQAVGFVKVAESSGGYFTVFRERLTNFMYVGYDRNDTGENDTLTGVAPLYDPEDGTPLTWERYTELTSN